MNIITDHNFSDATKPQTALTRAMKITANLSSLRWQMPMVVQIISGYHSIRLPMNIKIIRLSMNIRSWLDESIKDHFYPRRLFIGAKNERISSRDILLLQPNSNLFAILNFQKLNVFSRTITTRRLLHSVLTRSTM